VRHAAALVASLVCSLAVAVAIRAGAEPTLTYLPIGSATELDSAELLSPDGSLVTGVANRFDVGGNTAFGNAVVWRRATGWSIATSVGFFDEFTGANFIQRDFSAADLLVFEQYILHPVGYPPGVVSARRAMIAAGAVAPASALPLPSCPDPTPSDVVMSALAISRNGTAVVGSSECGAYRWTSATGTVLISPPGVAAEPTAVSDDGTTVAGFQTNPGGTFRWSSGSGYQLLPVATSREVALSADGTTVAGNAAAGPFVWDSAHGVTSLGGIFAVATALSADGSTVYGGAGLGGHGTPFAWTRANGFVTIPYDGRVERVTPNGLVLVQLSDETTSPFPVAGDDILLWNPKTQWVRSLESLLRDAGIAVPDDGLHMTVGISDDGRTIAGHRRFFADRPDFPSFAYAYEPWVATLEVPTCSDGQDNDGDGHADVGADPGCRSATAESESPPCQDGVDNDGATGIDFDGGAAANGGVALDVPDPQCTAPWNAERAGCGLGAELTLLCALFTRRSKRRGGSVGFD
jgi:hypothetical protein